MSLNLTTMYVSFGKSSGLMATKVRANCVNKNCGLMCSMWVWVALDCVARSAMSLALTTLYIHFGKSSGLMAFNVHVGCVEMRCAQCFVIGFDYPVQYFWQKQWLGGV